MVLETIDLTKPGTTLDGRIKDLSGHTIGGIKVIKPKYQIRYLSDNDHYYSRIFYECKCTKCGKSMCISGDSIKKTIHKSCGCLRNNPMITHEQNDDDVIEYLYNHIVNAAKNQHTTVDPLWDKDSPEGFNNFKEWIVSKGFNRDYNWLERIDIFKPFSPDNCKVTNNMIRYKKKVYYVTEHYAFTSNQWAEMLDCTSAGLRARIVNRGYNIDDALRRKSGEHHVYNIDDIVTPEWRPKNRYGMLKDLGYID